MSLGDLPGADDAKEAFTHERPNANYDPALPSGPARDAVLALTYRVVVFSIQVQPLSIGRVVRHAIAAPLTA